MSKATKSRVHGSLFQFCKQQYESLEIDSKSSRAEMNWWEFSKILLFIFYLWLSLLIDDQLVWWVSFLSQKSEKTFMKDDN